ncbi:MAG: PAS domain S-box protein [Alphaproteobacteria bacterium]|nr:PAS domain S-box protein [Alphaproteobacteria bacterium]
MSDQQRFQLLVDGVTDCAIYMLDAEGRVANWNTGAERLKGYRAEEILGRHVSTFYTPEDRAAGEPERALGTAARDGKFEKDGWRVRKDGTLFWASVHVDALRDPAGRLVGFAKVTRDITERRNAQEALERARTALAESQKMEAIGQLTGGVAHDFNNLLTVILNNLDLLHEDEGNPRARRLIESAQRAGERGARLTQQLLAFARRQSLHPEPTDINGLIGGFEAVLRRACSETIALHFALAPEGLVSLIDGPQFESALLNLVVNARDAMPAGGTVTIATTAADLPPARVSATDDARGGFIVVSVRDTGEGMTPEVLGRAFDPFFTTKEVGKGTGLGLSQVYGFVAQSGGHVELESAPGRGTTVTLYLPRSTAVAKAPAPARTAIEPAVKQTTVLLVEDDPEVQLAAREMLRVLGCTVLTAGDAHGALDIIKQGADVDVLFTDVVMPGGVNGIALAREARGLRPDLTVLLSSGYPRGVLAEEHGLRGQFTFIAKPYRATEVAETLKALRENRSRNGGPQ